VPNLASLLERALPLDAVALLRQAGELAAAADGATGRAFLVGGPVRDLVLGRPHTDLDITVVGNGPRLAAALAHAAGGEVTMESEFATAKVRIGERVIDVATARRETYPAPAALPEVEPAGIDEDLARRDFTANAMAVALSPADWGALVDNHGGMGDTSMRRLRVLHEQSFVDDPTRMLRALRYEARLGFTIEPHTLDLMTRDAPYLARLSPARARAEIERILREPACHEILRRAEERGILAGIDSSLRVSAAALAAMERVAERGQPADLLLLALIASSLTEGEAEALARRLAPARDWLEVLASAPRFRGVAAVLENEDVTRSEVVDLLSPFPLPVVEAQRELSPRTRRFDRIRDYLDTLRHVTPDCSGEDLLAAGVPEGPLVGKLLDELRRARLDSAVHTKEEELALVRRRLPVLLAEQERQSAAGSGDAPEH